MLEAMKYVREHIAAQGGNYTASDLARDLGHNRHYVSNFLCKKHDQYKAVLNISRLVDFPPEILEKAERLEEENTRARLAKAAASRREHAKYGIYNNGAVHDRAMNFGPAPCEKCVFRGLCKTHYLSCRAFTAYTNGSSERAWMALPRLPNGKTHDRTFPTDKRHMGVRA